MRNRRSLGRTGHGLGHVASDLRRAAEDLRRTGSGLGYAPASLYGRLSRFQAPGGELAVATRQRPA